MDQCAHTLVASDLARISCRKCCCSSQSVIGEINLLTIMMPGQGRAVAAGVPPLCGEKGFSKKFPPDPPDYKQVHRAPTGPVHHSPDQSVDCQPI